MSRTLATSVAVSAVAMTTLAIAAAGPAAALPAAQPQTSGAALSTTVSTTSAPLPFGNAVIATTNLALAGKVPDEFKDFLPTEVTEFYDGLTEEDKDILKEIALRRDVFQTEEQALDYLKGRSEKLYAKAVELRTLLKTKLDALNPAAKAFLDSVVEELKRLGSDVNGSASPTELQVTATVIVAKYKSLPEEAQESLKANFPKVASVLQSEQAQKLAGAYRPVIQFVDSVLKWGSMSG
ncbi:hypothetical protein AB0I84_24645 [Streptomyces spectabilis]|uniref:hypothetical protein n=1 Tax=Streptomyces spectabilis TaxID=68270 RepID=UPI0033FC47E2